MTRSEASPSTPVRGRFAPSPTGPLHLGSLVAAVGSWLHARAQGGEWLVRMEDLDRPREEPGAAAAILQALEAHGLQWDGEVLYQSRRTEIYRAMVERLMEKGHAYWCGCTRKEIRAGGGIYRGTCRDGLPPGRQPRAVRLRVPERSIDFEDRLLGLQSQHLAREVGDFVILRADGIHAYQLAVVVDDAHQGITEVVRGVDLLTSTPRQVWLQELLGLPRPDYLHLPLILDRQGQKLSKQNHAPPLDPGDASRSLATALEYLGHPPPAELAGAPPRELLEWALLHWRPDRIPSVLQSVTLPATP